jgi:hypothetical protein
MSCWQFAVLHTAFSLIAVGAAIAALVRHKEIRLHLAGSA